MKGGVKFIISNGTAADVEAAATCAEVAVDGSLTDDWYEGGKN